MEISLLYFGAGALALIGLVALLLVKFVRTRDRLRAELAAAHKQAELAIKASQLQVQDGVDQVPLPKSKSPALHVQELVLTNIRCFQKLRVTFDPEHNSKQARMRTVILGDNALGKSTVLRSLAIALCNESDAIALMKAMPGAMIRQGTTSEAEILVRLRSHDGKQQFEIRKSIYRSSDGSETLRQHTKPDPFPWHYIFVCGYGTQRTAAASASFEQYSPRLAVSTLFDAHAALQNPEVVLLRQPSSLRKTLIRKLMGVMLLDGASDAIDSADDGLRVSGPWGDYISFSSLSDGYRSTAQWILDLFAWMIYANRHPESDGQQGILLIDEIEQHLHPRWQRHIMQRLSRQLPNMQVIVTTHTPLVASGMADVNSAALVRLYRDEDDQVQLQNIDPKALAGKRADQVLVEFFDLVASSNPGSSDDLKRFVDLRSMSKRSNIENEELEQLSVRYKSILRFGETEFEQTVEEAVNSALSNLLNRKPDEAFNMETKRQLRELFERDAPNA